MSSPPALDDQRLLAAITAVQSDVMDVPDPAVLYDRLLGVLLDLTASEYGFIGEVHAGETGPYLHTRAITDIAWDDATRAFYAEHAPRGMRFTNLDTLYGEVIRTGRAVISNAPAVDPRRGGLPPGHPAMHAFLGVPIRRHGELIGMFGVANRPGGYDDALVRWLVPLNATIAAVIEAEAAMRASARRLQAQEDQFQLVLDATNDGAWDWHLPSGEVRRTPRYASMLGFTPGEVSDDVTAWGRLLHPEDAPRTRAALDAHLAGKTERYVSEHRLRHRDGSWVWVLDRGKVVERDAAGRPTRMIGTHVDITDKKRLEERVAIADRMVSLGTMAAGIAHEINNPLAVVALNTELSAAAVSDCPDPTARQVAEYLAEIDQSVARIARIVASLRGFSSPQRQERRPIAIDGVVEAAIAMTRNELRHRAVLDVRPDPVARVVGDEVSLIQVVVNLLMNAAQAIAAGDQAENRIALHVDHDERSISIEVTDTGIGIAPGHLSRVFDPFFTTKPVGHGTGLGLSVAHGIVTAHGGTIAIASEPGRGTSVRVALPRLLDPAEPAGTSPSEETTPSPRVRVLVIDDDEGLRVALARMLGSEHDVATVADGREALELLRRAPAAWDAVLCDVMMPNLGGAGLHAALAELDPELAERVVFITGGAFDAAQSAFVDRLPPERRIDKPFRVDVVRRAVREVAGNRRRR